MGEHKRKNGEIKGLGYRKGQREPIRGRYAKVASPGDEWYERRFPGYIEKKAKERAERARKEAEAAAKSKAAGAGESAVAGQQQKENE